MRMKENPSSSILTKLRRWYLLALSVIALVLLISHGFIDNYLDKQLNDSRVINVAGRQRMLSQKLTKEVLLLSQANPTESNKIQQQLTETLNLWRLAHEGLKQGNDSLELPGENSPEVLQMFANIQRPLDRMVDGTNAILNLVEESPDASIEVFRPHIETVLTNEPIFLKGMDRLVFQYDKEAKEKVISLRRIQFFLLIAALGILLLELAFIFRPTAVYVQKIIQKLTEAEQEAQLKTEEMTHLFEEKERSLQELRALNFAVDQATLFASTTADGTLLYISEKLSTFLGYKHKPEGQLPEILSVNEGEQQYIAEIIRTPRSMIWTGEVSITNRKKEQCWLELSIVPVNRNGVQQDYLILCSNITARKQTEETLQRLNQEKFEEEFRLQKLRSLQVIEAQENERKRIARDMHDGIGQMLTALKFNLESINPQKPDKALDKIDGLKKLARKLIKGVRMATFNLTPPELTDYGVATALAKLCSQLSKLTTENILFENKTGFGGRLEPMVETNIYRITQEAVNNAIKYAQATYILVTLAHSERLLSIVVEDDGVGFDRKQNEAMEISEMGSNMGLNFMKERVEYVKGRLFIRSAIGEGTRITINIPIQPLPSLDLSTAKKGMDRIKK